MHVCMIDWWCIPAPLRICRCLHFGLMICPGLHSGHYDMIWFTYCPERYSWSFCDLLWVVWYPLARLILSLVIFRTGDHFVVTYHFLYIYVDSFAGIDRPKWGICCSGWGLWWWRALCFVFEHDMRMLYESYMHVFDMVVHVGMCPTLCMMNDVVCVLWLVWVVY